MPVLPRPARRARPLFAALALVAAAPAAAQQHDHHQTTARPGTAGPALGTIVFPNSGAPAAQEPFLRGMALLHSFEYADAAQAFRAAQQADPAFAPPYWGEALTYAHVVWGREDLAAARAALARLAPTGPRTSRTR